MEIEYREPKLHGKEYINVIEYDGKPYFRLEDVLYAVAPGVISERLVLNGLYPVEGEVCLANYITLEWTDDDEYKVVSLDPKESRRKANYFEKWIYVDKPAALALLLDKDEDYLNKAVKKIIRIYGLDESDKQELYMLLTHLWILPKEVFEEIDKVADYNQYLEAIPNAWWKDNFDKVLEC